MLKQARQALLPFQSFVRSESAGGVLLIIAAAIAFVWANSSAGDLYEGLKQLPVSVGVGGWGWSGWG